MVVTVLYRKTKPLDIETALYTGEGMNRRRHEDMERRGGVSDDTRHTGPGLFGYPAFLRHIRLPCS